MTSREWKNLPELIRRCEVAAVRMGKQLRFVKVTVSRMLAREFRN
jgi:hypothetical protein